MRMRIGEVARRTSTPASTIRYYEQEGILPEPVRLNGQRMYDEEVLDELRAIKLAQNLNFTLREIKTLLDTFRSSTAPSSDCRQLAQQKLDELEQIIVEAQKMKRILEHGITCDCTSLQGCFIKEGSSQNVGG